MVSILGTMGLILMSGAERRLMALAATLITGNSFFVPANVGGMIMHLTAPAWCPLGFRFCRYAFGFDHIIPCSFT